MNDHREYQKALGQVITRRRERLNYTRDKLARLIGMTANYVTLVEDGRRNLELSEMILISRALQLPLSTLLALVESDC